MIFKVVVPQEPLHEGDDPRLGLERRNSTRFKTREMYERIQQIKVQVTGGHSSTCLKSNFQVLMVLEKPGVLGFSDLENNP
jgi:hypothetical protein